jgi:hypothetical protein
MSETEDVAQTAYCFCTQWQDFAEGAAESGKVAVFSIWLIPLQQRP